MDFILFKILVFYSIIFLKYFFMLFFDALFKFYFAQPLCKNYKHAQKSLTILHQLDALFCFTLIAYSYLNEQVFLL